MSGMTFNSYVKNPYMAASFYKEGRFGPIKQVYPPPVSQAMNIGSLVYSCVCKGCPFQLFFHYILELLKFIICYLSIDFWRDANKVLHW
jgi:hypothetical protein